MTSFTNIEKFNTNIFVKTSLILLYLALTFPIPFITTNNLKLISLFSIIIGFILILNITNEYVETNYHSISYKTSFISNCLGKNNWEIQWRDIKQIKSYPTSQGNQVHYFIIDKKISYLIPQRLEKFDCFINLITNRTNLNTNNLRTISPLWTYKLLSSLSFIMLISEFYAFTN